MLVLAFHPRCSLPLSAPTALSMPQAPQLTPETLSGPEGEQGQTQTIISRRGMLVHNTQQRENSPAKVLMSSL